MKLLINIFAALVVCTTALAKTDKAVVKSAALEEAEIAELRVYMNAFKAMKESDEKTLSGRQKWHGKLVKQWLNEERFVEVYEYEDGFVYEQVAKPKKIAKTAEERAELKRKRVEALARRMPKGAAAVSASREENAAAEPVEETHEIYPEGAKQCE